MHDDRPLIDVVNYVHVYVVRARVVVETTVAPAAAVVSGADVTKAIVNATVEADFRPPVARVPEIRAVGPAPVAGRPEQANRRRFNPRSGNPEISAVVAVAPVAGRPDVAIARANRLRVNGKNWWSDRYRQNDLR